LAVTWCGLLDLCHRDAIREADGVAMMTVWRVNMLRFWNGHHPKYFTTGHRLLAGVLRSQSQCYKPFKYEFV